MWNLTEQSIGMERQRLESKYLQELTSISYKLELYSDPKDGDSEIAD